MRYLRLILLLLAFATGSAYASEGNPGWEQVRQGDSSSIVDQSDSQERIDVTVRDGYIYVSTSRPITVRVMTILGQLISQQQIPSGQSRLKVNARGIYILKVGTLTRRVTV